MKLSQCKKFGGSGGPERGLISTQNRGESNRSGKAKCPQRRKRRAETWGKGHGLSITFRRGGEQDLLRKWRGGMPEGNRRKSDE